MKNNTSAASVSYSEVELIKKLPGFTNHYVTVNDESYIMWKAVSASL